MIRTFPGLTDLAARQAQVVIRWQLARMGADRHDIERREALGVWRCLGARVVVLHRGDLAVDQRWWAGYLHALVDDEGIQHPAALSGLTAARAGGLSGFETQSSM